ncbi:hypothetical protein DFH27DRAFT_570800 [Peziza echinospora]|nr:hypothetical protein DFH27DRAFT_570800 [Peziza echinospora]
MQLFVFCLFFSFFFFVLTTCSFRILSHLGFIFPIHLSYHKLQSPLIPSSIYGYHRLLRVSIGGEGESGGRWKDIDLERQGLRYSNQYHAYGCM